MNTQKRQKQKLCEGVGTELENCPWSKSLSKIGKVPAGMQEYPGVDKSKWDKENVDEH